MTKEKRARFFMGFEDISVVHFDNYLFHISWRTHRKNTGYWGYSRDSVIYCPSQGSASSTSLCWFICSTSCVFYPVWFDNKGIKLAWGYNISCHWNLGACLYGFKLLKSRVVVLYVACTSRAFLIYFGVHYWYFGQCQNSSASYSEGCGSSVKRSSSADAGHLGNATEPCTGDGCTWNNIEGINSDKSIDIGRPSLALRSSSCRSVVRKTEVGSSYVDRNLKQNSSLVVCSSSGLESQGGDSSTSTSANQQILHMNLVLAFQEKLSDPRITSNVKAERKTY
ncbi:hypothetical protein P3S67_013339 [Capsicum chacoense]